MEGYKKDFRQHAFSEAIAVRIKTKLIMDLLKDEFQYHELKNVKKYPFMDLLRQNLNKTLKYFSEMHFTLQMIRKIFSMKYMHKDLIKYVEKIQKNCNFKNVCILDLLKSEENLKFTKRLHAYSNNLKLINFS